MVSLKWVVVLVLEILWAGIWCKLRWIFLFIFRIFPITPMMGFFVFTITQSCAIVF